MQLESLAEWKKRAQASRLAAVLPASQGSIFKITPTGVFTELHDFDHLATNNDGDNPYAGLILGSDGNFMAQPSMAESTAQVRSSASRGQGPIHLVQLLQKQSLSCAAVAARLIPDSPHRAAMGRFFWNAPPAGVDAKERLGHACVVKFPRGRSKQKNSCRDSRGDWCGRAEVCPGAGKSSEV